MVNIKWYEIWIDEGISPPYILMLCCCESNVFQVLDIIGNKISFEASDYDTARIWLQEDEFTLVDGRMLLE